MDFAKVGVRVLSFKGNTNEQSQANISTTAEINISVLSGNIEGQTLALIGTFSVQAMWKLLLAEGEKGVLIWAGSADSQGVYALVSSLGSLFVRIILQPFEVCLCGIEHFFLYFLIIFLRQEAAFITFSASKNTKESEGKPSADDIKCANALLYTSSFCTDQNHHERRLSLIFKLAFYLGLIVALHGPQYSRLALSFLYGRRWAETEGAASTLSGFAVMVFFLATNGILEAYTHAVMTPSELSSANLFLLSSSILNVICSITLQAYLGALGLIVANCLTMSARIFYAIYYILRVRLKGARFLVLADLLPRIEVFSVLFFTSVGTVFTSSLDAWIHLGGGVLALGLIGAVLWLRESSSFTKLKDLKRRKTE